jgi:hypothetical protein
MEAASKAATPGIRRAGPPQAVQKLRENLYVVQVALSESPSADWKRFFYDLPREFPPEFPPRAVEMHGAVLRFRSDAESVAQKLEWLERWMERANQKESSLGPRSQEDRRRREDVAREHQELAALNARWAKL